MDQITQLKSQYPDSALGHFLEKIVLSGSATIELQNSSTENSHDPDASLLYTGAEFPGIVIEVAHSQPKEALAMLAQEYIFGTGGNVRCVVGLKIEYPRGKQVTLSVWERSVDVLAGGRREGRVLNTVQDQASSEYRFYLVESANRVLDYSYR
jgi:hypothetical protein